VDKHYDEVLPLVPASEGRLSQVFLNLVINAVHAMRSGVPERNVLRVKTLRDGDWARVEISDTGTGIAPDVLPRIFEPFFTTKTAGMGTGLGLSISQSILQKMGGSIQVRSELGVGTTFTLSLPVHGRDTGGEE
jgi:two-component system, NtrC family, sensor kinase